MRFDDESLASGPKKLYRYFPNTTYGSLNEFPESLLDSVLFNRKIINKNSSKQIVFINCLVEFGCESLLPHYFLPSLKAKMKSYHKIIISWYGRNIFYSNYADEIWEIDKQYMFLRQYTNAFHGMSKNIKNIENALKSYGLVYSCKSLGNEFLKSFCHDCQKFFYSQEKADFCLYCKSNNLLHSLIADPDSNKNRYVPLPLNLGKYNSWVNKIISSNKVIGIFARKRFMYGRNLPVSFYIKFINYCKSKNYEVLWLGEKESTLECPDSSIFDFTKSEFADDLEACLALTERCTGTLQCWTASTRLSQLTNTPFCLVESFDQLCGNGQEGKRIKLLTRNDSKKKIIICNYQMVMKQLDKFEKLVIENFFDFIENKNCNTIVGIVESPYQIQAIIDGKKL